MRAVLRTGAELELTLVRIGVTQPGGLRWRSVQPVWTLGVAALLELLLLVLPPPLPLEFVLSVFPWRIARLSVP